MTDLIPSDRAAGSTAALDVVAMLESLVQATGAPYAFLACQSANEPTHASIIAASRRAAELFPSRIPLEGEFWRELARTGECWIDAPTQTHGVADPVFAAVNGASVAALIPVMAEIARCWHLKASGKFTCSRKRRVQCTRPRRSRTP